LSNQSGVFGPTNTTNYGHSHEFISQEWTWSSDPGRRNSLIDFDLTGIPANATIVSASLSLYHNPDNFIGPHSQLDGTNQSTLTLISESWGENTVTWDNQPNVNSSFKVTLPQSTSGTQDYLDIDVFGIVNEMHIDPLNAHGMLMTMDSMEHYRGLFFASSDHPDPTLHPKLLIEYTTPVGVESLEQKRLTLNVFPNPANEYVVLEVNNKQNMNVQLFNLQGQLVEQLVIENGRAQVDVSGLTAGCYLLRLFGENESIVKQLIVSK